DLGLELRADRELLAQVRAARGARVAGRDEAAGGAARDAEDADDEAALGDLRDGDLEDLVRRHALAHLHLFPGGRGGVQGDLVSGRIAARHDDLDLVADLHHLLRVVDGLDREVGRVDEAVDAGLQLDERAEGLEARDLALVARADGVLLLHRVPRVCHGGLAAQPQLALVVDLEDLDLDLRALLEDLVQPGAAVVARLRHVDEALDAAGVRQGDERAPLDHLADDALVEAAGLEQLELLGADLVVLLVEHLATRDDDVAALLRVLRDDEVEPLADEVAQVGAVAQVDVRGRREGAEAAEIDLEAALHGARDEAVHGLAARRRFLERLARLVEDDRQAREHEHAAAHAGAGDGGDELIALDRRLVAVGQLAPIEEAGGLARDVDPHRGVGQLADLAEDLFPDAEGRAIAVVARGAAGALLLPGRLAAFAGVLGLTLAFVLGGLVLLALVLFALVLLALVRFGVVRLGGRGGALGAGSS